MAVCFRLLCVRLHVIENYVVCIVVTRQTRETPQYRIGH